jgi:DNA-binding response OmpR family regulator
MEMRPKALIVEDDAATSRLLRDILLSEGCDSDVAFDGETAMTHLRGSDYDLMLLDIILPRASGLDVMDWLRQEKAHVLERTIVVTGVDLSDIRQLFPTVSHVLSKPVIASRLVRSIQHCLLRRRPLESRDEQFTRQ